MARRFYLKRQVKRLNPEKSPEAVAPYGIAGSDSEFYLIEKALNKAGFARHPTETLQNWIRGLSKNPPALHGINDLKSLLALHYRYRFDPKGIKTIERAALKSGSQSWLDKYNKFSNSRNKKP
jgi:hypothetical protein